MSHRAVGRKNFSSIKCLQVLFFVHAIVCGLSAFAGSPDSSDIIHFNIPAQPLSQALADFSRQADTNVVATSEITKGKMSTAVNEATTTAKAIERLLEGTQLKYRQGEQGAIIVTALNTAAADQMALAQNTGNTGEENKGAEGVRDTGLENVQNTSEEIVVTGTNIRGAAPTGSPLRLYSREEIEKSGVGSVAQFIERLPQNFGSVQASTSLIGRALNADMASGVDLRGLGSRTTLVLVNGRRLANSSLGDVTDVSSIPLAAIDRIEVLPDGASAIYGSDAVAGVVNFVLRKDYQGGETRLRYEQRDGGSSTAITADQAFGSAWASGNAMVAANYSHSSALLAGDRDYDQASDDTTLDPSRTIYSLLGTVNQQLTSRLNLSADGFYARRDGEFLFRYPQINYLSSASTQTDQASLGLALEFDLTAQWRLRGEASYSLSEVSQTILGRAFDLQYDSKVTELRTIVDGALFQLPAGALRVAFGVGGRTERNPSYQVTATNFSNAFDRDVVYAFGEVNVPIVSEAMSVPLVDSLVLSAAGRYEDYSDFGTTVNPKFGIEWRLTREFGLLASYGTSFSASRYNDVVLTSNAALIQRVANPACPANSCLSLIELGNRTIYEPEESKSFTAGMRFEPVWLHGLRAQAGYYRIDYSGRIGSISQGSAFFIDNRALLPDFVTPNPAGSFIQDRIVELTTIGQGVVNVAGAYNVNAFNFYLDRRRTNLSATRTDGVDLDVQYSFPIGALKATTGIAASKILDYQDRLTPIAPQTSGIDDFGKPASLRASGSFSIDAARYSASALVHYVSGYDNTLAPPTRPVDSWTTIDLNGSVSIGSHFASAPDAVRISLSVQNVLNKEPPFASRIGGDLGYDPTNANAFGRVLSIGIVGRW